MESNPVFHQCPHCNRKYKTLAKYEKHIVEHSNPGDSVSSSSSSSSVSSNRNKKDKQTRTMTTPGGALTVKVYVDPIIYVCPKCYRRYRNMNSYTQHMINNHNQIEVVDEPRTCHESEFDSLFQSSKLQTKSSTKTSVIENTRKEKLKELELIEQRKKELVDQQLEKFRATELQTIIDRKLQKEEIEQKALNLQEQMNVLIQKKLDSADANACIICLENPCCYASTTCGHLLCCQNCYISYMSQFNFCGMCRKQFTNLLKVY